MKFAVGLVTAALATLTLVELCSSASGADETATTSELAPLRLRGYLRRHHHCLGGVTFLNITPWWHAGRANQLELLGPGGNAEIQELALWVY